MGIKQNPKWLRGARIEYPDRYTALVTFQNVTARDQRVTLRSVIDESGDQQFDQITVDGVLDADAIKLLPIQSLMHWAIVGLRQEIYDVPATFEQSRRTLKTARPGSDEFLEAVADVFRESYLLRESGIDAVAAATGKSRSSAMRYVTEARHYVAAHGLEPLGTEEMTAKRRATVRKKARAAKKSSK